MEEKDSLGTTYTKEIEKAIREFQKEHRLQLDGIIGSGTIAMLNKTFENKHGQILVNLERWRWYPRNLGEQYMLINIADFSLNLIKDGDTLRTHKVVVGRKDRKTPVFSDTIEYLVFNPDWTIPPTIKKEDVIPAVRKNTDYLKNNDMEVFDSNGKKLNPYAVDWGSSRVYSFTYRQNPGPSNPMGRVKIIYPNDYLIFSHDNPAQHLFENNVRANSSGCVRVKGAIDLAKYLLEEKLSSKEADSIIESRKTKKITIEKDVKVHHFYWTAWRENGNTKLINDLYGYDKKVYDALKSL